MSKINATYSSGYYLAPDADYRKIEDEREVQRRKRRREERRRDQVKGNKQVNEKEEEEGEDDERASSNNTRVKSKVDKTELFADQEVKRQTFAIPFDLICLHCEKRIARGTHVYTNRRFSGEKYLGAIKIWSLEIRCKYCHELFYLHTDPETAKETGGYVCASDCRRVAGDFHFLNKANEEVKCASAAEQAEAQLNPLEALERENEAARELAERNRAIAEDVAAHAIETRHDAHVRGLSIEESLLASVRMRHSNTTKSQKENTSATTTTTTNYNNNNTTINASTLESVTPADIKAERNTQNDNTSSITTSSSNNNDNQKDDITQSKNNEEDALLSRWQELCSNRTHTTSCNKSLSSFSSLPRYNQEKMQPHKQQQQQLSVHKNKFMVEDEDDDDDDDDDN